MAARTVTEEREALLEMLHAQRKLPPADERKRIRKAARVSIRQLAAALGVSPMAPVRWEQGAMPRNPEHVREYADLLAELERLALPSPEVRTPGLAGRKGVREDELGQSTA